MKKYITLIEGVKNATEQYPQHPALVFKDKTMTYQAVMDEAQQWAHALLSSTGQTKLRNVAIFSYRNPVGFIGSLAALITGAAFIPLNPRFPSERNISILKQCKPDAIIVDSQSVKELIKIANEVELPTCILSPENTDESIQGLSCIKMEKSAAASYSFPVVNAEDVAYILFTSGSTGLPKGVPITHENVCSFLAYNQSRYQITSEDKLSQTFEQTFDLSVFDLFMSWCHGAALHLMRPIDLLSPYKYINDNKITVWFSVPSIISLLKKQGFLDKNIFPSLRLSLFCGEPLHESEMIAWADAAPNSICENLYGPTELTIACSTYRWIRNGTNVVYNGIVSIGQLYDHLKYILVNENKEIVQGEGELCVTGAQRFAGYLDANDVKPYFIETTDKNGETTTYYRTGDRVKLDTSGNILYVGRIDQQIKINGYRIELGEIESVLSQVKGVDRALAFCLNTQDDHQNKKLVSYIVGDVSVDDIIIYAKRMLPSYMVPSLVKVESNVPLNFNGKVDRKTIALKLSQELM